MAWHWSSDGVQDAAVSRRIAGSRAVHRVEERIGDDARVRAFQQLLCWGATIAHHVPLAADSRGYLLHLVSS
jgi:hypothetical protein